jgi:hypothetical protein
VIVNLVDKEESLEKRLDRLSNVLTNIEKSQRDNMVSSFSIKIIFIYKKGKLLID